MKKHLYILGGGHAGSSAALSAARYKKDWGADFIEIHLIDKNPHSTVKPRLYEYELEEVITPFSAFLPQARVHFHQDEITRIETTQKKLVGKKDTYTFDVLIVAPGSQVNNKWEAENIDSYSAARQLQEKWKSWVNKNPGKRLKIGILGAGFTGIELATEMPINFQKYSRESKKELPKIELTLLGSGEIGAGLGENPKPVIQEALKKAGVKRISNVFIEEVKSHTVLYTQNGKKQQKQFDLIINTTGQTPNPIAKTLHLEEDKSGRIVVDQNLRPPKEESVFIAGDTAAAFIDNSHKALMTCQQGRPQGRYAGYNAVAFLSHRELITYQQPNYVTCLDLGSYGALYTEGWDRKIRFRGKEAKKFKKHINQERIYPPFSGKKEDLYAAGALHFKGVMETIKTSKFR